METKKEVEEFNPLKIEEMFIKSLEPIKSEGEELDKELVRKFRDFFYKGCYTVYNIYEGHMSALSGDSLVKARQYVFNQLSAKKLEEKAEKEST